MIPPAQRSQAPGRKAFSLVELLVSMAVLSIILLVTASVLAAAQTAWSRARTSAEQFREARIGFERMTDRISQATLSPYWDNEFDASLDPVDYVKRSELHFITGPASVVTPSQPDFQTHGIFFLAPFGQSSRIGYREANNLLNAWGYALTFGDDQVDMPTFVASGGAVEIRHRFRLVEFRQNTEELTIYDPAAGLDDWYRNALTDNNLRLLAENIIALVIHPMRSDDATTDDLSPAYLYDSRALLKGVGSAQAARWDHELPPLLRITMVAVDERTVSRLQGGNTNPHPALIVPAGSFQSAADYEADLEALETQLLDAGFDHRVFSTIIPIRNSKWSE